MRVRRMRCPANQSKDDLHPGGAGHWPALPSSLQYTGSEMKLACCGACQICCVAFW
jgi:hypothetical protein